MKKFLPLIATMLLLTACGTSTNPSQPTSTSGDPATSAAKDEHFLTFLSDKEIYIDFNFDNKPEGLSIKIGDTTLTESGKATMSKDISFQVNGTFTNSINIYHVTDAGGSKAAGKAEGLDADQAKTKIENYLEKFFNKQYEYRVYFCLSDKASGWSKTLPGVDGALKSYAGTGA